MVNAPLTPRAKILVVEDDAPIRSALDIALRGEGYEVRAEPDGVAFRSVVQQFRPDLAILDVGLPAGPNGLALAGLLQGNVADVPVLFLTAADGLEDRLAGFEAGGDDYLAKPFLMAELVARVRAVLRRAGRLSSPKREIGDLVVDDEARTVTRSGEPVDLTNTEFELLSALARRPGHVFTKIQLLSQVWGLEAYDDNLVEVHICALRRKLEANSGTRLVHTVRGAGYVLRP